MLTSHSNNPETSRLQERIDSAGNRPADVISAPSPLLETQQRGKKIAARCLLHQGHGARTKIVESSYNFHTA
jgi:hypothetical protein